MQFDPTDSAHVDGRSATQWDEHMIVYGGPERDRVWFLHVPTSTWSEVVTKGEVPEARRYHSAVVWNGKLLVTGGELIHEQDSDLTLILYELDLETYMWSRCFTNGATPTNRTHHNSVVFNEQLVLFGGKPSNKAVTTGELIEEIFHGFYDISLLPLTEGTVRTWQRVEMHNPETPTLWGATAVPYRGTHVLFFGGFDVSVNQDARGEALKQLPQAEASDQTYVLDMRTYSWQRSAADRKPPARALHTAVVHHKEMLVFGGVGIGKNGAAGAVNDFWRYNIPKGAWTQGEFCAASWPSLSLLATQYGDDFVVSPNATTLMSINFENSDPSWTKWGTYWDDSSAITLTRSVKKDEKPPEAPPRGPYSVADLRGVVEVMTHLTEHIPYTGPEAEDVFVSDRVVGTDFVNETMRRAGSPNTTRTLRDTEFADAPTNHQHELQQKVEKLLKMSANPNLSDHERIEVQELLTTASLALNRAGKPELKPENGVEIALSYLPPHLSEISGRTRYQELLNIISAGPPPDQIIESLEQQEEALSYHQQLSDRLSPPPPQTPTPQPQVGPADSEKYRDYYADTQLTPPPPQPTPTPPPSQQIAVQPKATHRVVQVRSKVVSDVNTEKAMRTSKITAARTTALRGLAEELLAADATAPRTLSTTTENHFIPESDRDGSPTPDVVDEQAYVVASLQETNKAKHAQLVTRYDKEREKESSKAAALRALADELLR